VRRRAFLKNVIKERENTHFVIFTLEKAFIFLYGEFEAIFN